MITVVVGAGGRTTLIHQLAAHYRKEVHAMTVESADYKHLFS